MSFHNTHFTFYELKGDEKGRETVITKLLQIGLIWRFLPMVYKSNSCLLKTHILSLMTPTFFVHFLRDTLSISYKKQKKGRGHQEKVALGPLDQ